MGADFCRTSHDYEDICNDKPKHKRKVRIYTDGCWDVMHSGHYNAIRQAKALGDTLIVGIHSDKEIERNKRKPVMNNEQRIAAVKACKWVDEIAFDVPYTLTNKLLNQLNCDYLAHGDDMPVDANGNGSYDEVLHKLKIFPRTHGISTTQIIQKLLYTCTNPSKPMSNDILQTFSTPASRMAAFSNNRTPTTNDIVIYIDGIFDLFHIGHIAALEKAKELGTFLYVGLYNDEIVSSRKGKGYPLMNLQERLLNVLSCKYVDDVIVNSPWIITKEFLKSLNIKYVVQSVNTQFGLDEFERYDVPRKMGMFKQLKTNSNYTTDMLIQTIIESEQELQKQNETRIEKMKEYAENCVYVQERMK